MNISMDMAEAAAIRKRLHRLATERQDAFDGVMYEARNGGPMRSGAIHRRELKALKNHFQPLLLIPPFSMENFSIAPCLVASGSAQFQARLYSIRRKPKPNLPSELNYVSPTSPFKLSAHAFERFIQFYRLRLDYCSLPISLRWLGLELFNGRVDGKGDFIISGEDGKPDGHFVIEEDTFVTWIGERSYGTNKRKHFEILLDRARANQFGNEDTKQHLT